MYNRLYFCSLLAAFLVSFPVIGAAPPTQKMKIAEGELTLAHYPGLKKAVFEFFVKKDFPAVNSIEINGYSENGLTLNTKDIIKDKHWKQAVSLVGDCKDKWLFSIKMINAAGKIISQKNNAFTITVEKFPWENNILGTGEAIIKPFIPMTINGNTVNCLLRKYKFSSDCLFKQINTDGQDLLSKPIFISLGDSEISELVWEKLKFVEKAPHKIVLRSNTKNGKLKLEISATVDYDGMVWYNLVLSPLQGHVVKINKLSLKIPLKEKMSSLFNVVTAMSRYNKADKVPLGQDVVWDSFQSERKYVNGSRLLKGTFIPYIWIGNAARGICWFADSSKGFALAENQPAMKMYRKNGTLTLDVALVNKPVNLKLPREIQFGMQATPVKKIPDNWHSISCLTHGKDAKHHNLLMPVNPKFCGFYVDWSKYPIDHDYSFLKFMASYNKSNSGNDSFYNDWKDKYFNKIYDFMNVYRKDVNARLKRWFKPEDTLKTYYSRRLDGYYRLYKKMLENTDGLVMYTNPTLNEGICPEFKYYATEWWGPLKNDYHYVGGKKNILTDSYINYYLWYAKKMFENGAQGIYLDDFYITPGMNVDSGTADLGADGKTVIPKMGILAQRKLVKRLALMMQDMNMDYAFITVHLSGTSLVPVHSFANMSLGGEVLYRGQDYIYRFTPEHILAENAGLQSGLIPFALRLVCTQSSDSKIRRMQEKEQIRSFWALNLLHGIKTNSRPGSNDNLAMALEELFSKFGVDDSSCKFIPYWENCSLFSAVCAENIKISVYRKNDEAIFIASNLSDKTSELKLSLRNTPDFNSQQTSLLTDMETNKRSYDKSLSLNIPEKGFSLIYAGSAEKYKKLPHRKLAKLLGKLQSGLKFETSSLPLRSVSSWKIIARDQKQKKNAIISNTDNSLDFSVDNCNSEQNSKVSWCLKFNNKIPLENVKGIEIVYSANGIPIRYNRGHAIVSIEGKDKNGCVKKCNILRCVDIINGERRRKYCYFGDLKKIKFLDSVVVSVLGMPRIKAHLKIEAINLLTLKEQTFPESGSLSDSQNILQKWPNNILINTGDISVRLAKSTHWTLHRIDYKGKRLGRDSKKTYYGTVIKFPDIGFIGSGHNENENEKILSLSLTVNGKKITNPKSQYNADSFCINKKSLIKNILLDTKIEVSSGAIKEEVTMSCKEDTRVDLVYHFMQPWITDFSDYAVFDKNQKSTGVFSDSKKSLVCKPVKYIGLYSKKLGKGVVNIVCDVPENVRWINRYWDVPRQYRKHYLQAFKGGIIHKKTEYKFKMITIPFSASPEKWTNVAEKIIENNKYK